MRPKTELVFITSLLFCQTISNTVETHRVYSLTARQLMIAIPPAGIVITSVT